MKCLECGNTDFEVKNVRFTPAIKGHLLEVVIPCHVCKGCHSPFMDTEQVNTMRRVASDLYRKNQNLLTSDQIVQYRTALGFSQAAFAGYLKVGEASIRRWESYSIQDDGQDDHIRTKCDLVSAEKNYFHINAKAEKPDYYNGNRRFSPFIFDQISAFFLHAFSIGYDALNKLHFYADFLHFNHSNHSITGIKYIAMKNGPAPCRLKMFTRDPSELVRPNQFTLSGVDDKEIKTLQNIAKHFKSMGEQKFCQMAQTEKGYLESNDNEFISYKYAKDLLIS